MKIKQLSQSCINRIAAGEVVERPASVIKELVENSIDAGATSIDVIINNGGRNLISVNDNGFGMSKEELLLAIKPHTTSKLNEEDITDIRYFGFRGEALPSIASVSRMNIISRIKEDIDHGWKLIINGGEKQEIIPDSIVNGTKIEVRDLFFATPARLKFLKSEKVETQYILEMLKKIALANPKISFSLKSDNKQLLNINSEDITSRVRSIMVSDFMDNSVPVNQNNELINITGFVSLPTFNRRTSTEQYLFVNNRPVKDKILISAVKVAYQDYLSSDRHPVVILFLNLPPSEVDVNVHPTKAEVRFIESNKIRGFIIGAIKKALDSAGHLASTTIAEKAYSSLKIGTLPKQHLYQYNKKTEPIKFYEKEKVSNLELSNQLNNIIDDSYNNKIKQVDEDILVEEKIEFSQQPNFMNFNNQPVTKVEQEDNYNIINNNYNKDYPLGSAKCQLHQTYIVAQSKDSIIIVDQHAAHERIVYEELKEKGLTSSIKTQRILIPEIIELEEKIVDKIIEKKEQLKKLGLVIEQTGNNAVRVLEIPDLIATKNITQLIKDIGDDLIEYDEDLSFKDLVDHVIATYACHHSVRAGKVLSIPEMNSLLRKMEATPYSGQCNHGRPTYVELKLSDIERLFGRS